MDKDDKVRGTASRSWSIEDVFAPIADFTKLDSANDLNCGSDLSLLRSPLIFLLSRDVVEGQTFTFISALSLCAEMNMKGLTRRISVVPTKSLCGMRSERSDPHSVTA